MMNVDTLTEEVLQPTSAAPELGFRGKSTAMDSPVSTFNDDGIMENSEENEFVHQVFEMDLQDDHHNINNANSESMMISLDNVRRIKPFLVLVCCIAAFGGFLFGVDLGGIGASFLMKGFRYHFEWSECAVPGQVPCQVSVDIVDEGIIARDKGLISFFFGIGATFGSVINPYFGERGYGRRPCLALSTLVYLLGAVLQTSAPTMWVLWIGRLFIGIGIGMLSMIAPVYVAECAPEHVRGSLGIFWDFATTLGIVVASAANIGLKEWDDGWKFTYGSGIIFGSVLLLSVALIMPESPRWLAAHSTNDEELTRTLSLLRYENEIEMEKANLRAEIRERDELGDASWKEIFSSGNMMRRRVFLGAFFFAVQQLSGGTAVNFYAPDILNTFFTEDQAIMGMLGLAIVALVTTALTVVVVERFGRTKLLVYGGVGMAVCLIVLGLFSSMDESLYLGVAILCSCAVFNVFFSLSWGPALWVLCSEIFPYRARGKATGVTTMSHWLFATIVSAVFPVASTASLAGCFLVFATVILMGTGSVYFLQVETSGMTSAQIDEAFLNHKPTLKRKDW